MLPITRHHDPDEKTRRCRRCGLHLEIVEEDPDARFCTNPVLRAHPQPIKVGPPPGVYPEPEPFWKMLERLRKDRRALTRQTEEV